MPERNLLCSLDDSPLRFNDHAAQSWFSNLIDMNELNSFFGGLGLAWYEGLLEFATADGWYGLYAWPINER